MKTQIITLFTLVLVLFSMNACRNRSTSTSTTPTVAPVATSPSTEIPVELPTENLLARAETAGNFTTLLALVEKADLVEKLSSDGPFTLFAPTDEVFAALPQETQDALDVDEDLLLDTLLYHLVADKLSGPDLQSMTSVTTILGEDLMVITNGDTLQIGEATIVTMDIGATNGVIHVIDTVLNPPLE